MNAHFLWRVIHKTTTIWVSFLPLISVKILRYHLKAVLSETWVFKGLYTSVYILVTYIELVQTFFGQDLYLNALKRVVGRKIECVCCTIYFGFLKVVLVVDFSRKWGTYLKNHIRWIQRELFRLACKWILWIPINAEWHN